MRRHTPFVLSLSKHERLSSSITQLESVLKMRLIRKRDASPHPSIPDGPDDQGMAPHSGLLSRPASAGAAPQMGIVADCECHSLRDPHGVSVADAAAGLPAVADRLWLLLALAAERAVGAAQYRPGQDGASADGTRAPAQCRHYRQSECQDLRRWGSTRGGCVQANQWPQAPHCR